MLFLPKRIMSNNNAILPVNIFNAGKADYEQSLTFFGEKGGLLDSINRRYPKLWTLYKTLKKNDWDETEFNYLPCNTEFKTCDRSTYEIMLRQLAWQWQGDSVAARSVIGILAPVISATEVWTGYCRIVDNENIHALTYSEIVRMSFDNPDKIISEILSIQEAQKRLVAIARIFDTAYELNHKYALGQIEYSQELYEANFMFLVALYCLERLQFMASFLITFAICHGGQAFKPIGLAVQRIAEDEYEIHAPFGAELLRIELSSERGKLAFKNNRQKILNLIDEVATGEMDWIDYSFSEGRTLTGMTPQKGKNWVSFCAYPVYYLFGLEKEAGIPLLTENPCHFMTEWINIDDNQGSPQEIHNNNYKTNVVNKNISDRKFTFARPGKTIGTSPV